MEIHEADSHVTHTSMLLKEFLKVKTECMETKRANREMKVELHDSKRDLNAIRKELGTTQGQFTNIKKENDKLRQELIETRDKSF